MTAARTPDAANSQHSPARSVSRPHDPHEREADRAADVVARGGSASGWSFSKVPVSAGPAVQRQEAGKPKSDDDKKKEAATKAGEAALATPQGQALKEKVLADPVVKGVKDAVTSPAGLVATGVVAAGGVGVLAATGKSLPFQPPAIPLEKISPKLAGVSAQVTYEGPVNAPTFVGLSITVKEQGPKGKKVDPIAAETARLKAQDEMFRRGRTLAPGSKEAEDERLLDQAVSNYVLRGPTLPGLTIPLKTDAPKKDEETTPAQRTPASSAEAPPAHAHVDDAISSPGRPLDAPMRRSMEARFGYDFSRVRLHDDAQAAAAAGGIDASAFTVGDDIVFGAGSHEPTSLDGRRLLAHELAHTMQQRRAPGDSRAGAHSTSPAPRLFDQLPIQREPTRPRAVTGAASTADLSTQTATVSKKATVGSLARTEWESLFKRHFVEPDTVEYEVESSHARYIYSRIYGWIDAMHFFAHIQYAEEKGLAGAMEAGIAIEGKQGLVRKLVGPDPDDTSIYNDLLEGNLVTPEDFLWYREGTFMAIDVGLSTFLPADQQALLKGFSEEQRAKLMLDNAMSAWSYEDLVSNQLGVQFFAQFGAHGNAGSSPDEVKARLVGDLTAFFASIYVVEDAAEVKRLAKKLPGRERWTAPKLSLAQAQKKYPELFSFGAETHRVRVAVYDREDVALRKRDEIAKLLPSIGAGLRVEAFEGSRFALYTEGRSHFLAVLSKWAIDRAVPTGKGGGLVEREPAAPTQKRVYGPQP